MIDFEQVSSLLIYDPEAGKFYWKERSDKRFNTRYAGKEAGTIHISSTGRKSVKIKLKGKNYFAHRLAFLLMTKENPDGVVDHKDQDPLNNKWNNLRCVSQKQNMRNRKLPSNNRTGYIGVYQCSRSRKYIAKVNPKGYLGSFSTAEQADEVASEYRRSLGFSESHGKSEQ